MNLTDHVTRKVDDKGQFAALAFKINDRTPSSAA